MGHSVVVYLIFTWESFSKTWSLIPNMFIQNFKSTKKNFVSFCQTRLWIVMLELLMWHVSYLASSSEGSSPEEGENSKHFCTKNNKIVKNLEKKKVEKSKMYKFKSGK